MHLSASCIVSPSSVLCIAVVGQLATQGASLQWLHIVGM